MLLIVWITVYNFSKLQRVQASRLAAPYWLFDIKLSLAKRIYIKFISERRTWLRVRDPSSVRRSLSADSHRVLQLYADWLQSVSLVKCLRPKQFWSGRCAADAMTSSDICQIGGFIYFPSSTVIWFSEKFTFNDFAALDIPVTKEMQKCIASLKPWLRWQFCRFSAAALLVSDFRYGFLL